MQLFEIPYSNVTSILNEVKVMEHWTICHGNTLNVTILSLAHKWFFIKLKGQSIKWKRLILLIGLWKFFFMIRLNRKGYGANELTNHWWKIPGKLLCPKDYLKFRLHWIHIVFCSVVLLDFLSALSGTGREDQFNGWIYVFHRKKLLPILNM